MARYCFLEFDDLATAHAVLDTLNNQPVPGTNGVTVWVQLDNHMSVCMYVCRISSSSCFLGILACWGCSIGRLVVG